MLNLTFRTAKNSLLKSVCSPLPALSAAFGGSFLNFSLLILIILARRRAVIVGRHNTSSGDLFITKG